MLKTPPSETALLYKARPIHFKTIQAPVSRMTLPLNLTTAPETLIIFNEIDGELDIQMSLAHIIYFNKLKDTNPRSKVAHFERD